MALDLEKVIAGMKAKGMPASLVASVLDIDEELVANVDFKSGVHSRQTPEDLGHAMQDLAWRAYFQAIDLLENGSYPVRIALIRSIYSRTAAYMRDAVPQTHEELRTLLVDILEQSTVEETAEDVNKYIYRATPEQSDESAIQEDELAPLDRAAINSGQKRGTA